MRAVVAGAGPDLIRLVEVASPIQGDGEVLVDVSAISVNRGVLRMR